MHKHKEILSSLYLVLLINNSLTCIWSIYCPKYRSIGSIGCLLGDFPDCSGGGRAWYMYLGDQISMQGIHPSCAQTGEKQDKIIIDFLSCSAWLIVYWHVPENCFTCNWSSGRLSRLSWCGGARNLRDQVLTNGLHPCCAQPGKKLRTMISCAVSAWLIVLITDIALIALLGDTANCPRGGGARDLRNQVPAQGLHPCCAQTGEGAQDYDFLPCLCMVHCLNDWQLLWLFFQETLQIVLEVVELGVSGTKSQPKASIPAVLKQEKELKPTSTRVKNAAEGVLSCILNQLVGITFFCCGSESQSWGPRFISADSNSSALGQGTLSSLFSPSDRTYSCWSLVACFLSDQVKLLINFTFKPGLANLPLAGHMQPSPPLSEASGASRYQSIDFLWAGWMNSNRIIIVILSQW